ncbi:MAG: hypothetical protein A3F84_12110 [Candidatus Handelsmanbacteria bacterium RIFCSPLOWO2_12_FULL_64_10]|uniref:Cyclic nucleotide-binding domain-containing protein n=1 Tax=Handelsmanbacteria sp. (strain RIFCSPLOWO2_12_FULL_64_10) TaxID=1817868 RepID=A0A1F6CFZ0_HANXR|nr:MAG: hypothetical protein A3F84_12110 [Candidatus Handelsmanbacteria bacterium RIFCSPLOWO2_12_FULL_64_10]
METADYFSVFSKQGAGTALPADDALLLPDWSAESWGKLLRCTVPQPFHASEVVLQRGATDRALFFIVSGALEVGITQIDGVSIIPLAHIGAGSIVGEQSFFDGHTRSANVWAVSPGEMLRLEYQVFRTFSEAEPALARDLLFAVARVMSARMRNTTLRVRR